MKDKAYLSIVTHYESCLERHGDTHLGVDWPRKEDAETRYRVMLEIIRHQDPAQSVRLLDFGCGASHLYEYIMAHGIPGIAYSGLDISEQFVRLSQNKFPGNQYYCMDVLADDAALPMFDYVTMNGVFTEKGALPFDEMYTYFKTLLTRAFKRTEIGLAFNVMSKHVDWERDDLFHMPFDLLATFLGQELTRNYVIRGDYGLYEYTTYVYR
jgi:SAM-dependent methyltransferase